MITKNFQIKNLPIILLLFLQPLSESIAQEIEPRIYSNAPAGINIAAIYYSLAQGNIFTDPALPLQDFQATTHSATMAYARTMDIFGKLWKLQVVVPYTHLAGDVKLAGKDTSGTKTGFADARFRVAVNLFGSPAIPLKDFKRFKQASILGISLVVNVPSGQYDKTKRVNLGSNRWGFKPEVGFSHRWGQWYLETYAGVWFFTTNSEFLEIYSVKQEEIYSLQWHIIYNFKSGPWISIDGAHVNGGKVSIDEKKLETFQQNWRLGAVFSYPFNIQHSIKLTVQTGLYTRLGSDFDVLSLGYQYIW